MTAKVGDRIFVLRSDLSGFRWFYADGRRTDIWRFTVAESHRAFLFLAYTLPVIGDTNEDSRNAAG